MEIDVVDWNFSFAFLGWAWFLTGVELALATWALRHYTTDGEYKAFQAASILFGTTGSASLAAAYLMRM